MKNFGLRIADRIRIPWENKFRVGERQNEMKEKNTLSVALKIIGAIAVVSAVAIAVAVIIKKISDKKKAEAICDLDCDCDDFCDCECECECECDESGEDISAELEA